MAVLLNSPFHLRPGCRQTLKATALQNLVQMAMPLSKGYKGDKIDMAAQQQWKLQDTQHLWPEHFLLTCCLIQANSRPSRSRTWSKWPHCSTAMHPPSEAYGPRAIVVTGRAQPLATLSSTSSQVRGCGNGCGVDLGVALAVAMVVAVARL